MGTPDPRHSYWQGRVQSLHPQTTQQLRKDLKKHDWKFFGPTTYAFMQAMGLVNDHMEGGASHEEVKARRQAFTPPASEPPIT